MDEITSLPNDPSPPCAELIASIAANPLTWKDCLCEWIDNALDAKATVVEIAFDTSASRVTVTDNGVGAPSLVPMYQLGKSQPHPSTKLGRYGIGAKDAAIWAGGEDGTFSITSTHGGMTRSASVPWKRYAGNGWVLPQPAQMGVAKPNERGTCIVVSPCKRKVPEGKAWLELTQWLGYIYSNAIKKGAQICTARRKNDVPKSVPRWVPPDMEPDSIIQGQIEVNGKTAQVYCGIIKEGVPNTRSGLTYFHGFRVIEGESRNGCGPYSTARICGWVELSKQWKLAKLKNRIVEDDEALYAAVENILRPTLERAHKLGMTMEHEAFADAVSRSFGPELLQLVKAKRGQTSGKHGAKRPTGEGSPHRQAERTQVGSAFPGRGSPGIHLVYMNIGEDGPIGKFKSPEVQLNDAHPIVRAARDSNNLLATSILVAGIVSATQCMSGQLPLKGLEDVEKTPEGFARTLAYILSTWRAGGSPLVELANAAVYGVVA